MVLSIESISSALILDILAAWWVHLAAMIVLYFLRRWHRERQTVENLTEKYVFITGCDSGFGNQLARQLDLKGMRVLAACLTQKGAEELEKNTSDRLKTTILDVTSTESVAAAAEWVKRRVGDKGLWGVVNNAGVGTPMGLNEWMTKEDFVKVISVNLLGVIDVTLQMLPLVKRCRGRVVNVGSTMGRLACFGGGYCPAKYGVEAFSDSLRRELRCFGVRVSIVEPGAFITPIMTTLRNGFKDLWDRVPSNIKVQYGQQYFEAYRSQAEELLMAGSKNLNLVTDSIEHALTSCHPRTRYSAGWDAKLFYLPVSYLPTSIADYILTRNTPKPAQAV